MIELVCLVVIAYVTNTKSVTLCYLTLQCLKNTKLIQEDTPLGSITKIDIRKKHMDKTRVLTHTLHYTHYIAHCSFTLHSCFAFCILFSTLFF